MSQHFKTEIRDKVADVIQQAVPDLSPRTVTTRVRPSSQVPWCSVTTPSMDRAGEGTGDWPKRFFDVEVEVTIAVKAASGYDVALDDLEAQVTAALAAEPTLGGLAKVFALESSEDEWDDELDKPTGRLRMTWRALVRMDGRAPAAPIQ